jgi:hypothetical protein
MKRPTAFHNSASPRIMRTTAEGEGAVPSNTMSAIPVQRSQISRPTTRGLQPISEPGLLRRHPILSVLPPKARYLHCPRQHTTKQKVGNGFLSLVAEGARLRSRESTLFKPVRRPAPVMQRKPKEESTFGRGSGLPDFQSTNHGDAPHGTCQGSRNSRSKSPWHPNST